MAAAQLLYVLHIIEDDPFHVENCFNPCSQYGIEKLNLAFNSSIIYSNGA